MFKNDNIKRNSPFGKFFSAIYNEVLEVVSKNQVGTDDINNSLYNPQFIEFLEDR